mmetsp:Transcript_15251/g.36217  ORF Transcript_15251/g.36217 Transcript_15251/m.36217 type:complete len:163 (+) Transcript_15251:475-963(+)
MNIDETDTRDPQARVEPLRWEDADAFVQARGRFDIVAGADLVYGLEPPTLLVDTVATLLAPGGVALLTFAPRTPNAMQAIGERSEFHGLTTRVIRVDSVIPPSECVHGRFIAVRVVTLCKPSDVPSPLQDHLAAVGETCPMDPAHGDVETHSGEEWLGAIDI